jgi:hypothetical protein
MNPYMLQVPIYVPLPVLLQAQANYLSLLQKMQDVVPPSNILDVDNNTIGSNSSSLHQLEKSGVSAYSLISRPQDHVNVKNNNNFTEVVKADTPAVVSHIRKGKKVSKPWHLPSHKLFRNAIFKHIFEELHDPLMSVVLNRLTSVGCDIKKFAFALESKLYYNAERLEEYLEFTTLKKRICEEIKKTKKVYI